MPGKNLPESFTPASRLKSDSIKSPTTAVRTQQHAEDDCVQPIHASHFVTEKMHKDEAGNRRNKNRAAKTFPRFSGTDARNHFVPADERADRIRAGVAEFCHQNKIEQKKFTFDAGEKIDFLDEVQQPRYIHQAKKRRGDGRDSSRVGFRHKLPHAQTEHEQNQKTRFKIVHARGRTGSAEVSGQIQKRSDREQNSAEQPAPFETDETALFGQSVKFHQTGGGEQNDNQNKNAVRDECAVGKQSRDDDRPENHRGDQPAEKDFCL